MNGRFTSLMYHSLGEKPDNQYDISLETFNQQIKILHDAGYIIESFDQFFKRLIAAEVPLRYIVISFDDGYRSFLKAAEILDKYNVRGTFFLTKDWCEGKGEFLNDREIYDLSCRHEVGGHSVTHPNLTLLSNDQIKWELSESKSWLEGIVGSQVKSFSIPGGYNNSNINEIATNLGYNTVGNSFEWWNRSTKLTNPLLINRVAIRKHFTFRIFNQIISCNKLFFSKRLLRTAALYLPKKLLNV